MANCRTCLELRIGNVYCEFHDTYACPLVCEESKEKNEQLKLERIINHFGKTKQIYVVIEEMSELTKALTKSLRDKPDIKSVLEEMADVELCMRELRMIYSINQDDVEEVIQQKIQRTLRRIDTEKLKEAYKNARAVD